MSQYGATEDVLLGGVVAHMMAKGLDIEVAQRISVVGDAPFIVGVQVRHQLQEGWRARNCCNRQYRFSRPAGYRSRNYPGVKLASEKRKLTLSTLNVHALAGIDLVEINPSSCSIGRSVTLPTSQVISTS